MARRRCSAPPPGPRPVPWRRGCSRPHPPPPRPAGQGRAAACVGAFFSQPSQTGPNIHIYMMLRTPLLVAALPWLAPSFRLWGAVKPPRRPPPHNTLAIHTYPQKTTTTLTLPAHTCHAVFGTCAMLAAVRSAAGGESGSLLRPPLLPPPPPRPFSRPSALMMRPLSLSRLLASHTARLPLPPPFLCALRAARFSPTYACLFLAFPPSSISPSIHPLFSRAGRSAPAAWAGNKRRRRVPSLL